MGAWSESITGNDTAEDLLMEYPAAFLKYEPEEAISKIGHNSCKGLFRSNALLRGDGRNIILSLGSFRDLNGLDPVMNGGFANTYLTGNSRYRFAIFVFTESVELNVIALFGIGS